MLEGLAHLQRSTGKTVADRLGLAGPRAIVCDVMVERILSARREQAVAAIGMVFPVIQVG